MSINLLNKSLIAIERRMTPVQLQEFKETWFSNAEMQCSCEIMTACACGTEGARFSPSDKEEATRKWIVRMESLMGKSGKEKPEAFIGKRVGSNLFVYTNGSIGCEQKTLVVCFTGAARRMMMPLAVWLQHFDAREVDIALVICPKDEKYRSGVKGIGEDVREVLANLCVDLSVAEYKRAVSAGTSAGAAPALLMALANNLSATLTVGLCSPVSDLWFQALGVHLGDLARQFAAREGVRTSAALCFGMDHALDAQASFDWEDYLPAAEYMRMGGAEGKVGHDALRPLLQEGRLSEVIRQKLLEP